jgi:hypothetical protein
MRKPTMMVKLNNHLKKDMTAIHRQTNLKGLWEYSRIIFQNSRSTQKWKNMCMMECFLCSNVKDDYHQCRHLTE